ncbi:MAG: tryptophan-rich sensory protein [Oscillatoria princeps RMCB-10]|nr:tryptophan-rich sensory protein [Oscillatoria princeps RMCB-10]
MKQSSQLLNSDTLRSFANLMAILAAFGVNVLANIAPINGLSIGAISNQFFSEVLIIPANYTFAIWGLIYLGLIAFGIYQVLPAQRQNPLLRRTGYLLVVASLSQIVWVLLFQYRLFPLSVVAMLGILLPLIALYLRLGIAPQRVSRAEKWFVRVPLSIYLAWICVATIVNVAIALYSLGWNGWGAGAPIWTVLVMAVGAAIAANIALGRADIAYALVTVWAYVGIAVRQASQPLILGAALSLALAVLLALFRGLSVRRQLSSN